jgi:small subunit ribosomal protein S4e
MIMAGKGNKRHMFGLVAPEFYSIKRKEHKFVMSASPGRHNTEKVIPLSLLLKRLEIASTGREVKEIVKTGNVTVNSKIVKDLRYPLGLNDVITLKGGKSYIVGINSKGQSTINVVDKPDYNARLCKVVGKYKTKSNAVMIRLHDGATTKAPKEVRVNDSVVVDAKLEVKKVLPMSKGAQCIVIDGVHVGTSGKIFELKKGTMSIRPSVVIAPKEGKEFETIISNIMVVG